MTQATDADDADTLLGHDVRIDKCKVARHASALERCGVFERDCIWDLVNERFANDSRVAEPDAIAHTDLEDLRSDFRHHARPVGIKVLVSVSSRACSDAT